MRRTATQISEWGSGSRHYPACHDRRGVLLLVVLSMLALFMMLGVAYVVTATRAREAARAYSRLTFGGNDARIPHDRIADAILLRVVRGGASPGATGTNNPPTIQFESLLADKFGTSTITATASGFAPVPMSGTASAILTGTLALSGTLVRPTDLNGRLLTFSDSGRPTTSHRIIRAQPLASVSNSTTNVFALAIDSPVGPKPFFCPKSATRAIINGREFDGSGLNEPWDGFDADNPHLARIESGTTISTGAVFRASYAPTFAVTTLSNTYDYDGDMIPDAADNDNDGVNDGIFLDFGLPEATDGSGNTVQLRASVLILDLDGRFNANAHDSLPRLVYAGTTGWTTAVATGSIPLGGGYGPAEVNGMSGTTRWTSNTTGISGTGLFPGLPPGAALNATTSFATSENPSLFMLTGGLTASMTGTRAGGSRYTPGQQTPQIPSVEGKYGERAPSSWSSIVDAQLSNPSSTAFAVPGGPGIDDPSSRMNDRRAPPFTVPSVSYGAPAYWWTGATFNWGVCPIISDTAQPLPRGVFNSPPDLHGRMRTFTSSATAVVPKLAFAKAEWSGTSNLDSRETTDDPYELRLDTRLGFGGLLFDPTTGGTATSPSSILRDNPFTPSELEPVLRPYDIDTNRLPQRLPAMLGSAGEESRFKITTDSWDTTSITGSAATRLATWLGAATGQLYGADPLSGLIGGEVSRGERFDLNRPLAAADGSNNSYPSASILTSEYHLQRQAYCKDLFTLLMGLNNSGSAAQLAQWAANVAEFRDADSRVLPFEYDANPLNGWGVDGDVRTDEGGDRAVAWGAERPEIVIQEALAWRNTASGSAGMAITLHRPWAAIAYGSGTNTTPGEPCDYALDTLQSGTVGIPQNLINLGKKAATDLYSQTNAAFNDVSGTTYPIWRLRIVAGGSTTYVRFDTGTAAPGEVVDPTVTSGNVALKLGVDSTAMLLSGTTISTGSGSSQGSIALAVGGPARLMPTLRAPGISGTATLFLERLSDATQTLTPNSIIPGTSITGSAVWFGTAANTTPVQYMVIDKATVRVIETSTSTNLTGARSGRQTSNPNSAFWQSPVDNIPVNAPDGTTIPVPVPLNPGNTSWLAWPNRPFVSSAELLLVPQGNAAEILTNYVRLSPALSGTVGLGRGIPVPTELFLDAVHVPSRFAAIHRTLTQDFSPLGIHNTVTKVNQLSSFREPGRVNLNTVVADDVWNAVIAGQLPSPMVTRTAAGFSRSPAKNLATALALSGGAIVSDTTSPSLATNLNPLHEIYTATRLANTATPRSNVYAIWVTVRESIPNDPDSVKFRRAFYIVDRSIPVGFEEGRDHNTWDCVRLRRVIE